MTALSVPGSSDEATLAAGLRLPQLGNVNPFYLSAVNVLATPNASGFVRVLIADGGGTVLGWGSCNDHSVQPVQILFAPHLSSYRSGIAVNPPSYSMESIPSMLIDPSWTVRVILDQMPGAGGSIASIVFVVEMGDEPDGRPRPPAAPRKKKTFAEALVDTVARYGRTPGQAIEVLGG